MSDTLEIFGIEYTDVAGIIATDDNGNDLTYTRGGSGDNTFIITVSYNDQTNIWEPDCTHQEAFSAYNDGKTIVFMVENGDYYQIAGGHYADGIFYYTVYSNYEEHVWVQIFRSEGLFSDGDWDAIQPYFQTKNKTYTPTTSTQTETVTFDSPNYNGLQAVNVTVNAMPTGTAGTPTATKGTVSNHTISVTPSVTNTTGYITGSTKAGTAVTVSASELVSGTYSVTSSGTKDVTNYASASVPSLTLPSAASSTSSGTSKATISRSTSNQYINIPTGFNDTAQYYTISATPNGTVTAPSTITGTTATISTGTNTLTLTKSVSVTPNVTTAGYISAGTAGNASVSLTASVTTKAAATITPGTTNQTIASGTYLTGTQTIAGDADLVASNIVNGVQIFGVTGNVVLQNYYTGSSAPSSSLGSNGDLYLQS